MKEMVVDNIFEFSRCAISFPLTEMWSIAKGLIFLILISVFVDLRDYSAIKLPKRYVVVKAFGKWFIFNINLLSVLWRVMVVCTPQQ
jgi:hypothetical protein